MQNNIKNIFIDEGFELVSNLESFLMELETNGVTSDNVNGIFRVMHSLKGGSSMFGFAKLDELAHNLESIYNDVREDNSKLTQQIIDITFRSIDVIKMLLSEDESEEVLDVCKNLIIEIKQIDQKSHTIERKTNELIDNQNKVLLDQSKTYYILFRPRQKILFNGTNPLFIVEELVDLSEEYHVVPRINDIPSLDLDYNLDNCYVWWEIILYTSVQIDELESVFIFVEDNADIIVKEISDINIIAHPDFYQKINSMIIKNEYINYTQLSFEKPDQLENSENNLQELNLIINSKAIDNQKNKEIANQKNLKELSDVANKNEISNIKVSSNKLDELMNMVSELVTTQARLMLLSETLNHPELLVISEDITKITRRLRDNAFSIILIPIESTLIKYRRLVRDLSIELNKNIRFVTEGTDTELDKTIIETINEPILHLLRNAIDHGIEHQERRKKLGKPDQAIIKLKSYYSGASVHIQISDDGSGLDIEAIRNKAIEKKFITSDSKLTEKEIIDFIWFPGFTTTKVTSGVSGRGVGMDVVQKKISNVRGDIEVETKLNEGTVFTLKLPLTLSIIDGLLVQVDGVKYLIQLSVIKKIHKIKHEQLTQSFTDVIVIDSHQISYVYLREYFSCNDSSENEHAIIVDYEGAKVAIIVDEVLGEYQAVLKPLGKHYKRVEIFSGGTILGDGSVALVLDTTKIIREKSKLNFIK